MQDDKKIKHDDPEQVKAEQSETEDHPTKKEKKNKHKEIVESLEAEVKELKDKLLRQAADFDNFKKRLTQEKINDRKYASKHLIHDILIPLDQLNKIVHMPTDHELLKNFLIGFKMINDQIYQLLETDGLKEIDALNQPFDPKLHYAVEKVHDPDKKDGINIEVIQKGYTYKEQLLRPAMVKVNEWSEENGKDE